MVIARNHAERVSGLGTMAIAECQGDAVAAFAALMDAAVAIAAVSGVSPETARKRMSESFAKTVHAMESSDNG